MKLYDFKKAAEIIENERPNGLKKAELGMYGDWSWTAKKVFGKGEYKVDLSTVKEIAGIPGSRHDRPVLVLTFKDGTKRTVNCYQGESDLAQSPVAHYGGMFAPSGSAGLPAPIDA